MTSPDESDTGDASDQGDDKGMVSSPDIECPFCGFSDSPVAKRGVSAAGCLMLIAINILCFPLIVMLLFGSGDYLAAPLLGPFLAEEYYVCRKCRGEFCLRK
ncbi:MAG: hypothetical protein KDA69_08575 [Planctomycetaceae bacterium]|nr:hypothetical protein [Planctomycetaceae bacterium]